MNMKMCEASNMNLIYECWGIRQRVQNRLLALEQTKKHVKYLVIFGGQITLLYIIIYILYIHIHM